MKRLPTNILVLDAVDIISISFLTGSSIAWIWKIYIKKKHNRHLSPADPLIADLKKKSPIVMFSQDGKPLKPPLMRGGSEKIKGIQLLIKNKKLAQMVLAIVTANRKKQQLLQLRYFLFFVNNLLTRSIGLRIAVGGNINFIQIILLAAPSSIAGAIFTLNTYPIFGILVPIAILISRGIENIPDPYEQCRYLCEFAAEYHSKKMQLEMRNFNSLLEETAAKLQLPIDKVPLFTCNEQPLSLLERYKLKSLVESAKARNRVQHFSEFIKKFPECDPDQTLLENINITAAAEKLRN